MLGNVDPRIVQATPQSPVVYLGLDNAVNTSLSTYDGKRFTALNLADVTRLVLILPSPDDDRLPDVPIVFDSAVTADVITWTAGGLVTLALNDYAIPPGSYNCQLLAYDREHPDGQMVIDGAAQSRLWLEVRETTQSGATPVPLPDQSKSTQRAAGEVLSALRLVYEQEGRVYLLDPGTEDAPIDQFLGLTVTAAGAPGDVVAIQDRDVVDNPAWAWTVGGLVFAGSAGTLTQTPPSAGWELVVGVATSATRLNISIDEPVLLA
jgi:hypothetical protein